MPFSVVLSIDPADLNIKYRDLYIKREMIQRVFTKSVVSENDVESILDEIS